MVRAASTTLGGRPPAASGGSISSRIRMPKWRPHSLPHSSRTEAHWLSGLYCSSTEVMRNVEAILPLNSMGEYRLLLNSSTPPINRAVMTPSRTRLSIAQVKNFWYSPTRMVFSPEWRLVRRIFSTFHRGALPLRKPRKRGSAPLTRRLRAEADAWRRGKGRGNGSLPWVCKEKRILGNG